MAVVLQEGLLVVRLGPHLRGGDRTELRRLTLDRFFKQLRDAVGRSGEYRLFFPGRWDHDDQV